MLAEAVVVLSRQFPAGAPWAGVFLTDAVTAPSSWVMRA
jgi:hypothetical protein